MYVRILRLRHLDLRAPATLVLFEGAACLGALLALAEIVSGWGVLALPAVVAATVKLHDIVAGALIRGQLARPTGTGRVAVGRSPMLASSQMTTWIEEYEPDEPPHHVARGVAPVPAAGLASPVTPGYGYGRRPQPWVRAPGPAAHDPFDHGVTAAQTRRP
jgi:hypothetical protein